MESYCWFQSSPKNNTPGRTQTTQRGRSTSNCHQIFGMTGLMSRANSSNKSEEGEEEEERFVSYLVGDKGLIQLQSLPRDKGVCCERVGVCVCLFQARWELGASKKLSWKFIVIFQPFQVNLGPLRVPTTELGLKEGLELCLFLSVNPEWRKEEDAEMTERKNHPFRRCKKYNFGICNQIFRADKTCLWFKTLFWHLLFAFLHLQRQVACFGKNGSAHHFQNAFAHCDLCVHVHVCVRQQ